MKVKTELSYEDSVKILENSRKNWPFSQLSRDKIEELEQAYKVVQRATLQESPM